MRIETFFLRSYIGSVELEGKEHQGISLMFHREFPIRNVGMDGRFGASDPVPLAIPTKHCASETASADGTGKMRMFTNYISRKTRHALATPPDARCTRSDSSAFWEGLADRRLSE